MASVRRDGGHAECDDLAGYRARCATPARGSFAGHEIATLPAPDTGGVDLLATLARLDAVGIGEPSQDPDALVGLLSVLDGPPAAGGHSDYVIAVDPLGDVAALCHSINTAMWGTTGIVVDGIPIPDPAAFQQPALAHLTPGDHLPMRPDLVISDSVTSVIAHRDELADPGRVVDDRFPPACVAAAQAAGHAVTPRPADYPTLPRGFWAAVTTDPPHVGYTGARTPYGQGPVRTIP